MESSRSTEKSGEKHSIFRGGVFSALGRRDYRVLWSGALVSNIGTWVHTAVLLWFVKESTGSNAWVGAVNLANYLPVLIFVLPAGSLADYMDRKKVILWSQVVMMLCAVALGVLTTLGKATIPAIMVTTAVMGTAFALNFPAWQALLPDLVPRDDLMNAIALSAAQWNLARFIGPTLGGIIVTWSVAAAFYFNGISFMFVIAALMFLRTATPGNPPPPEGMYEHVKVGVRFVRGQRWMVTMLVAVAVVAFFGFSVIVLMPAVARDVLHRGSGAYGLLLGMMGLGACVGAPLVTYYGRRVRETSITKVSVLALGASIVALSFSKTYWLSCLITFWVGVSFLMTNASINVALQGAVDRTMRGRIMSLFIMMQVGVFPIGGQAMGIVSDRTSTPIALFVCGSACVVLAVVLLSFPRLTFGA